MTKKKLLHAIRDFFDDKKKKQKEKSDYLKKLLKELKKKEKSLCRKRDDAGSKDSKDFQKEIAVVRAQRKKGLRLLKELR